MQLIEVKDRSDSDVVLSFCVMLKEDPESFIVDSYNCIYHISGVFYDLEKDVFGYLHGDKENSEKRYLNPTDSDFNELKIKSFEWLDVYEFDRSKALSAEFIRRYDAESTED